MIRLCAGLFLLTFGVIFGLINPIPYNGQWLLGLLIALIGVGILSIRTTKEKK